MAVKPKQTGSKTRWRRRRRAGHDKPGQSTLVAESPNSGEGAFPARDRRGGPSEDRALYTCECGYVFRALVSTSVGCPHCGATQAW